MPLQQHPKQPVERSHQRTFRTATMAVVFALLCSLLVVWAPSPAQAVTAFASKFQVNVEGDIVFAANANTTCLVGCTTANSAAISYVDVDGTAASPIQSGGSVATFNSSTSDLAVPSGSTVLYAGLF